MIPLTPGGRKKADVLRGTSFAASHGTSCIRPARNIRPRLQKMHHGVIGRPAWKRPPPSRGNSKHRAEARDRQGLCRPNRKIRPRAPSCEWRAWAGHIGRGPCACRRDCSVHVLLGSGKLLRHGRKVEDDAGKLEGSPPASIAQRKACDPTDPEQSSARPRVPSSFIF
ncbi:hypothetical protein VUR80DRAFT_6721 [Thermomyces stellatus]